MLRDAVEMDAPSGPGGGVLLLPAEPGPALVAPLGASAQRRGDGLRRFGGRQRFQFDPVEAKRPLEGATPRPSGHITPHKSTPRGRRRPRRILSHHHHVTHRGETRQPPPTRQGLLTVTTHTTRRLIHPKPASGILKSRDLSQSDALRTDKGGCLALPRQRSGRLRLTRDHFAGWLLGRHTHRRGELKDTDLGALGPAQPDAEVPDPLADHLPELLALRVLADHLLGGLLLVFLREALLKAAPPTVLLHHIRCGPAHTGTVCDEQLVDLLSATDAHGRLAGLLTVIAGDHQPGGEPVARRVVPVQRGQIEQFPTDATLGMGELAHRPAGDGGADLGPLEQGIVGAACQPAQPALCDAGDVGQGPVEAVEPHQSHSERQSVAAQIGADPLAGRVEVGLGVAVSGCSPGAQPLLGVSLHQRGPGAHDLAALAAGVARLTEGEQSPQRRRPLRAGHQGAEAGDAPGAVTIEAEGELSVPVPDAAEEVAPEAVVEQRLEEEGLDCGDTLGGEDLEEAGQGVSGGHQRALPEPGQYGGDAVGGAAEVLDGGLRTDGIEQQHQHEIQPDEESRPAPRHAQGHPQARQEARHHEPMSDQDGLGQPVRRRGIGRGGGLEFNGGGRSGGCLNHGMLGV